MSYLQELIKIRGCSPQACFLDSRIFFAIYYKTQDDAFKLAAKNWLKAVKRQESFVAGHDVVIEKEISSEADFKKVWMQINTHSNLKNGKVWVGNIFSHASKQDDSNDGLEFARGAQNDGTLKQSEILSLQKLPWADNAYLILTGCNTGLIDQRGWCPAKSFALKQGVITIGQTGYAYFSNQWKTYSEKSPADKNIYLWAYARGKNGAYGLLSSGNRMPGKVFYFGKKK